METAVIRALEVQRPAIRLQWESLLRLEPVSSPLAQPDLLVRLLDQTLDEIFVLLRAWSSRRHPTRTPAPGCPCGRNPLLAYYTAGQQALREALVMIQAGTPALMVADRDDAFICLDQVFQHIARREIEAFCALCQFRIDPPCTPPPFRQISQAAALREPATVVFLSEGTCS
ncbi:MAG: hypothetical protein ABI273_19065 [Lacunisphaera sp.]